MTQLRMACWLSVALIASGLRTVLSASAVTARQDGALPHDLLSGSDELPMCRSHIVFLSEPTAAEVAQRDL